MKIKLAVLSGVTAVVALTLWLSHASAQIATSTGPTTFRIAVCNVTEVFGQYSKAKELAAGRGEQQRKLRIESDKRTKAIDDAETMLGSLKPGSEAYSKQIIEVARLRADQQTWVQIENLRSQQEYARKTAEMYAEITKAISDVADEDGLAVVIQSQAALPTDGSADLTQAIGLRQVLYHRPDTDITSRVIAILNNKYRVGH
jgi:Skp family chaperone for outer membrane proteins